MRIEVLIGMIASGKSTYARKRADEGALIVCHDGLTEMLHGQYRYEQEKRELYRRIEESIVKIALGNGLDVIIDRTHLTIESRKRWLDFARLTSTIPSETRIVAVRFPFEGASVHALTRFNSDPRGRSLEEWCKVALHHQAQADLEPLSDDEGFDQIIDIKEWSKLP